MEYAHVLGNKNEVADELAKLDSSRSIVPPGVFLDILHEPTIQKNATKAPDSVE